MSDQASIPTTVAVSDPLRSEAKAKGCGMTDQASIPATVTVSDPLSSEAATSKEPSTKALHKYIFSLITMLGVLLQLKQGPGTTSLFNTDYPTVVILIVALVIYGGSLIGTTYIRQAHLNLDVEKFMSKISLLFGAVSVVLELVILVPDLGLAALFFWIVWFVSFIGDYACLYLETLYKSAVARIVKALEKLKEYVARFIVRPEEQTGLP